MRAEGMVVGTILWMGLVEQDSLLIRPCRMGHQRTRRKELRWLRFECSSQSEQYAADSINQSPAESRPLDRTRCRIRYAIYHINISTVGFRFDFTL
jgi:hypothetical protein